MKFLSVTVYMFAVIHYKNMEPGVCSIDIGVINVAGPDIENHEETGR